MTDDKKQGRLVLENGRYVCRAVQNGDDHRSVDMSDAQSVRDRAYWESVKAAQDAWRNPW
jgi:hypothetical protein